MVNAFSNKMGKKVFFLLVSFVTLSLGMVQAQPQFTLKLGGGFPQDRFAKVTTSGLTLDRWGLIKEDTYGGAGLGFNGGVSVRLPIPQLSGLGVVFSIDGFYNGLNRDANAIFQFTTDTLDFWDAQYSLDKPKYLNFPVMVGLNYTVELEHEVDIYLEAGLGANVRYIAPFNMNYEIMEGNVSQESVISSRKYKIATTLGYRMNVGVTICKHYSLELGYYVLGEGLVESESLYTETVLGTQVTLPQLEPAKETFKTINPTILTLRLGYTF